MDGTLFATSLENLAFIYSQLDSVGVLTAEFPNGDMFFENDIQKLNYAFLRFLDSNPELDGSSKTTVQSKLGSGVYTSIYELFHDLKIASIVKILEHENNSSLYAKVDKFYRIATETLLREAIRLGVSLKQTKKGLGSDKAGDSTTNSSNVDTDAADVMENQEEKIQEKLSQLQPLDSTDGLVASLEKDFNIITSVFYNSTGKALSVFSSGNIPFFTSLNRYQSELDDREPIIDPSLGINITNVIPNISLSNVDNMSKFSDTNIKIPNIRQILENYMHPNWLRLISSQWLKHGSDITSLNFSFAPSYDETQSIISNDWKGLTWCQQVGFKNLVDIKEKYNELLKMQSESLEANEESVKNPGESSIPSSSSDKNEATDECKTTGEIKELEDGKVEEKDGAVLENFELKTNDASAGEINGAVELQNHPGEISLKEKIDLENVFQYDEMELIGDDETQIVQSGKVQSTISDLLCELSELRQQRLEKQKKHARYNKTLLAAGGKINKPAVEEVKLYNKIRRLITGLIEHKNITPVDLNIDIDKRIPVLQHTYQGTLPASFAVSNQKTSRPKRRR